MINEKKLEFLCNLFGQSYRESSNQILFRCPNCSHHKNKLSVNLKKNLAKCWICGTAGSLFFFVKNFGTKEQLKEWERISGQVDLTETDPFHELKQIIGTKEKKKEFIKIDFPSDYEPLYNNDDFTATIATNYLKGRNISEKDILMYKIGYCNSGSYEDRILIPSFDVNGNINFFVARTYHNHFVKYMNPKEGKEKIIFNELMINWNEPVILCEGIFDALIAGENSIPMLGSTLKEDSKLFQKLIESKPTVYVCLDRDAKKKELKIIQKLLEYRMEVFRIDIEPFEDIGSMKKEEFQKRKNDAKRVEMEDLLLCKMRAFT